MDYLDKFKRLYKDLGLLEVPLHQQCRLVKECWGNDKERQPIGRWAEISAPYISKNYDKTRILCLGKNLHEWGGFDALEVCFNKDRKKINRNKTNIFLWVGMFVLLFLKKQRIIGKDEEDIEFMKVKQERLNIAFDHLAFTNIIKCSPRGHRSEVVTDSMWSNCTNFILSKELELLEPKYIICYSKYGLDYLFQHALQKSQYNQRINNAELTVFENKSDCSPRWLVGTYHPSYPQFTNYSTGILAKLESLSFEEI